MAAGFFFVGCDTAIVLNQLTDDQGSVIANATVTGALYLSANAVAGGNLTFTPVEGVPGDYQSVIPASLGLLDGKSYFLFITAVLPNTKTVKFRIVRNAKIIDV